MLHPLLGFGHKPIRPPVVLNRFEGVTTGLTRGPIFVPSGPYRTGLVRRYVGVGKGTATFGHRVPKFGRRFKTPVPDTTRLMGLP